MNSDPLIRVLWVMSLT